MYRIAVINTKGGCGKTTIATSLAAYYANKGKVTCLTDYDPQGSSMRWLKQRSSDKPLITGVNAASLNKTTTATWKLQPSRETEISVIDSPAAVDLPQLSKIIAQCDTILIPVMPSQLDIHAATRFIEMLLIQGRVRAKGLNVGIVANRVHPQALEYQAFQKFLVHLGIPIVARLRNAQSYVQAIDNGIGIHDIYEKKALHERYQWLKLIRWLHEKNV